MNAAIKCLEDTLLIRRLQARELEHEKDNAGRIAAINNDIASLERGLRMLTEEDARCRMPDAGSENQSSKIGNRQSKIENAPQSPTIGDLSQNRPKAE